MEMMVSNDLVLNFSFTPSPDSVYSKRRAGQKIFFLENSSQRHENKRRRGAAGKDQGARTLSGCRDL